MKPAELRATTVMIQLAQITECATMGQSLMRDALAAAEKGDSPLANDLIQLAEKYGAIAATVPEAMKMAARGGGVAEVAADRAIALETDPHRRMLACMRRDIQHLGHLARSARHLGNLILDALARQP